MPIVSCVCAMNTDAPSMHIYICAHMHGHAQKHMQTFHLVSSHSIHTCSARNLFICVAVVFSCLVMSHSLWPHGLQHTRLPCPSPSPRACSNSCLLSQWCHPTISSSVVPFSSCLQSFPASGSFLMSWLFTSGGQSIGALASASVFPKNIQDWFPLGLTGLISSQSKGLSRVLSNTTVYPWPHTKTGFPFFFFFFNAVALTELYWVIHALMFSFLLEWEIHISSNDLHISVASKHSF